MADGIQLYLLVAGLVLIIYVVALLGPIQSIVDGAVAANPNTPVEVQYLEELIPFFFGIMFVVGCTIAVTRGTGMVTA